MGETCRLECEMKVDNLEKAEFEMMEMDITVDGIK